MDENYMLHDDVDSVSTVWSPCGEQGLLNIKSEVRIAPMRTTSLNLLTVDSFDSKLWVSSDSVIPTPCLPIQIARKSTRFSGRHATSKAAAATSTAPCSKLLSYQMDELRFPEKCAMAVRDQLASHSMPLGNSRPESWFQVTTRRWEGSFTDMYHQRRSIHSFDRPSIHQLPPQVPFQDIMRYILTPKDNLAGCH